MNSIFMYLYYLQDFSLFKKTDLKQITSFGFLDKIIRFKELNSHTTSNLKEHLRNLWLSSKIVLKIKLQNL